MFAFSIRSPHSNGVLAYNNIRPEAAALAVFLDRFSGEIALTLGRITPSTNSVLSLLGSYDHLICVATI